MGQSAWLREIHGREEGAPPPVDLAEERRNGDFVRGLITSGLVDTVHDLSDGGLIGAAADLVLVPRGAIPITTSGKIRRSACVDRYRLDEFSRLDVTT